MKKYIDITNDMINYVSPNSHKVEELHYFIDKSLKIHIVDGKNVILDYSTKELEVANWIVNTFGGKIYMLPKVNYPKNIKTPDYLWKNEYWDLKIIIGNSTRVIDNTIKKNKNQANSFIIDCTFCKLNNHDLITQLKRIFGSKNRIWLKKIILKRDNQIVIIIKRNETIPQPKFKKAGQEKSH